MENNQFEQEKREPIYTPAPNDNERYDDYDYEPSADDTAKKSIRGYRVVIVVLALILAGVSVLYFNLNRQQQADYELLKIDRDSIQSDLTQLIDEYDDLKYQNDTIAAQLAKASEMVEQLKRERRFNYNKLKAYQKEVGTLRAVMKTYLRQIDSLNTINKKVIGENVSLRKEISTANLRADVAEERATELENRVQQGAVLRARDIAMVCLNAKDKVVSRISRAYKLRVDLTLSANELANPGNRMVYVVIITPDGYPLASEPIRSFDYQGDKKVYSAAREVDYQNEDVDVSIYYEGSGFVAGDYKIAVYTDGNMVGSSTVTMR
ncbi:MAG: hypothetical protein J6R09_00995 [Alistipes sp.]|nr:hypothetical protein [Alistipes sp.]